MRNINRRIPRITARIAREKTPSHPLLQRKVEKGKSAQKFATPAIHIANGDIKIPSKWEICGSGIEIRLIKNPTIVIGAITGATIKLANTLTSESCPEIATTIGSE